jgi:hypothetical protein
MIFSCADLFVQKQPISRLKKLQRKADPFVPAKEGIGADFILILGRHLAGYYSSWAKSTK